MGGGWALQMQWQGGDAEGAPVLLVHLARLCNDCASAEQAQLAADALISQVSCCVPLFQSQICRVLIPRVAASSTSTVWH